MKKASIKKTTFFSLFFIPLLIIIPLAVKAFDVKAEDYVYIAPDQTNEGNLYAAGQNITIDGRVEGDVICAAQTITINGTVDGSVLCVAETIVINGEVQDNVRVAGNTININNKVGKNIMAFGTTVILGNGALVGWDMLIGAANVEVRGKIGRDLYGGAANVIVAGEIGRDVKLKLDNKKNELAAKEKKNLTISDNTKIGGDLVYTNQSKAMIAAGAVISGEVMQKFPKIKTSKFVFLPVFQLMHIYSILTSILIALVLIAIWGKSIKQITEKMMSKFGSSVGWGAVVMFMTPILAILLAATLVGIPLAIMLFVFWAVALCIAKIMTAVLVGRTVLGKITKSKKEYLALSAVIGVLVVKIIFLIPFLGWFLCLIAIWWGLGGMWLYFRKN